MKMPFTEYYGIRPYFEPRENLRETPLYENLLTMRELLDTIEAQIALEYYVPSDICRMLRLMEKRLVYTNNDLSEKNND